MKADGWFRAPLLAATVILMSCDGQGSSEPADDGAPLTLTALPDPCEWLGPAEAQRLLGLDSPPQQTPMGTADSGSRACVYTNPEQTVWINVSYQGLNPQVFSFQGQSAAQAVDTATNLYAHDLPHLESGQAGGFPLLAFGDAQRTIVVVLTSVGRARDLPEGISERLAVSSYFNPLLHLFAPAQSADARLAELLRLAERPVAQLLEAADG